jgi:subtilisin family serine protease
MSTPTCVRLPLAPSALLGALVAVIAADTTSARAARVTPGSTAAARVRAADLYVPGELIVKVRPEGRIAELADLNARFLVESARAVFPSATSDLGHIYRLKVKADTDLWHMALQYARHPSVVYAEPNMRAWLTAPPSDPLVSTQYNLHNTGQTGGVVDADVDAAEARRFYNAHPPAYDPVVAFLDTGVELDHPDLAGHLLSGFDFLGDDDDPSDTDGHGTGTASIVGAGLDNAEGISGLCPNCMIRPVRVGSWVVHFGSAEVAEGIVYAADPAQGGADVISMSLGGTCSDLWTDAVDYAFSQDVLLVAAAGNYTVVVVYPAAYPRVVAVGATDDRDEVPLWVPRIGTIDLYAPGVDVPVAERSASYGKMTGTSAATPHVAGTAALLRGQNPGLSAREIRQIIVDSADKKGGLLSRHLRLNTYRAMLRAQSPPASPIDPPHESCQILPLSAAQRAAVDRMVAGVDDRSHGSLALPHVLHRHRIQIGALVTVNPELTRRALDVANVASVTTAETDGLRGFLEALSVYGNADLRADLRPIVDALKSP